jgi:hypothetical protein
MRRTRPPPIPSARSWINELYYDAVYRNATPFAFVAPGRAGYLTLNWKF